jgi:hypothetical protein
LVSVFCPARDRLFSPLRLSTISEQVPVASTTRISAISETFSQSFMRAPFVVDGSPEIP